MIINFDEIKSHNTYQKKKKTNGYPTKFVVQMIRLKWDELFLKIRLDPKFQSYYDNIKLSIYIYALIY